MNVHGSDLPSTCKQLWALGGKLGKRGERSFKGAIRLPVLVLRARPPRCAMHGGVQHQRKDSIRVRAMKNEDIVQMSEPANKKGITGNMKHKTSQLQVLKIESAPHFMIIFRLFDQPLWLRNLFADRSFHQAPPISKARKCETTKRRWTSGWLGTWL